MPQGVFRFSQSFYIPGDRPTHVVFKVPESALVDTCLLTDVTVRQSAGSETDLRVLVFGSKSLPDLEMLSWCDKFTEAHWQAFQAKRFGSESQVSSSRAAAGGSVDDVLPHEPIGFLSSEGLLSTFKQTLRHSFVRPCEVRFVTLKFLQPPPGTQGMGYTAQCLMLDRVTFQGLPGGHPLSQYIGCPEYDTQAAQLITRLQALAASNQAWSLDADASLVHLVQVLSRRTGVVPIQMDILTLNPSTELLNRHKELGRFALDELRSRFGLVKYLNRLVTPLLNYVDLSAKSKRLSSEATNGVVSLSAVVHALRGTCGCSCVPCFNPFPQVCAMDFGRFILYYHETLRHGCTAGHGQARRKVKKCWSS